VTILTPLRGVAPYTHFTLEAPNLHRMMHEKHIHELCSHFLLSVKPGVATCYNIFRDGYKRKPGPVTGELPRRVGTDVVEVEFDTIIVATARKANDSLWKQLSARTAEWEKNDILAVYQAGDCYAPGLIAQAVFEGHRIAREFESSNPQRPQPWIRERQVWGAETYPKLSDREVNG
jgi:dimethylamine/trimethylamine dehydrogenase